MITNSRLGLLFAAAAAFAVACGKTNDSAVTDSAAPAAIDSASGTATAAHDMSRPPARDADHEFLRMMSDHHESLIQMATAAMSKGSNATIQGDAHKLHTKQLDEQKKMVDMVQASYGESLTPMVMGSAKAMVDDLQAKSGADYDRAFYRTIVAHHREAVKMVDDFRGRLTRADVKQMAERMKTDQQKEIAEFERKAGG